MRGGIAFILFLGGPRLLLESSVIRAILKERMKRMMNICVYFVIFGVLFSILAGHINLNDPLTENILPLIHTAVVNFGLGLILFSTSVLLNEKRGNPPATRNDQSNKQTG